jgi:hypothetical protein
MKADSHDWLASTLRWLARSVSIFALGMATALILGLVLTPSPLEALEWVQFSLTTAVCLGLVLGWWWEGTGGLVVVAGLMVLNAVNVIAQGTFPEAWTLALMSVPGLFFLLTWLRMRSVTQRRRANATEPPAYPPPASS